MHRKKMLVGFVALCFIGMAYGQKDVVSTVFDKYAGVEGFTAVNISGDMLKLLAQAEQERRDTVFTSKLSSVRILALEKGCDKPVTAVDLRAEVYDKLDKSVYKEMMTVKQKDEDVVILIRENNGRIAELLLLVSGQDDHVLIQVKGDILLSEMAHMTGQFPMKGFDQLRKLEK